MGTKEPIEQKDITSGICEPCFKKVMAEIEQIEKDREDKKNESH
jgi:hypothetical protein